MRWKILSIPVLSGENPDRERKMNDFLGATNVKRIFAQLANQPEGPTWSVLCFYDESAQVVSKSVATSDAVTDPEVPLTGEQVKSIVALKKWRADQAVHEGVPLYMVAQNRWLEDIVRMPNRSLDELAKIRGLGDWRVQKYGAKILEILNAAAAARRSWPATSYSASRA